MRKIRAEPAHGLDTAIAFSLQIQAHWRGANDVRR